MRAAQFAQFGNPLVLNEVAKPVAGPGEVIVDIHASGLCDTDCRMSAVENPMLAPARILGHQIAGRVESVGEGVAGIEPGSAVVVNFLVACGQCSFCQVGADSQCDQLETIGIVRDGGFAEWVAVPAANVLPIPDTLNMVEASFLACALATPMRALKQGRLQSGDVVLLVGEGLWTLGAIDLCHALGARPVLWSKDDAFVERAHALNVEDVTQLTGEELGGWLATKSGRFGAHLVVDFEASPETVAIAQAALGKGSRCVFVGHAGGSGSVTVPFPVLQFMESEITGSCLVRGAEIVELIDMAANNRLNLAALVTGVIDFDDINAGLKKIAQDSSLGIVIGLKK